MFIPRPNRNKFKIKPEDLLCSKCSDFKPFTSEYFPISSRYRFGLAYVCKICEAKRKSKQTKCNRAHANSISKQWQKTNRNKGLCIKCNQERLPNSNYFCEKHYFQNLSHKHLGTKKRWHELRFLLEMQQYKCAYTGIDLILGLNASVDHIKCKVNHPELYNNITNLCWADFDVNLMKREHDKDRFLELCEKVIKCQQ
jgi:hypothetical protein